MTEPGPNERSAAIDRFLAAHGHGGAVRAPLAGDASFRRYERVRTADGRTMVLMDAPPAHEDVRPFARLARHLIGLGLSAPEVLAADETQGFLLLEDLGDDTYTRLLAAGHDEAALYEVAVDALVHLHTAPAALDLPTPLPGYDMARLLAEARLLIDWHLPAVTGHPTAPGTAAAFTEAWEAVLGPVIAAKPALVLRDYHVDNLIWRPERAGAARCALLDFQDAVAGPAAYDLVSLLEDARRDISDDLAAAMQARYFAAFPDLDRNRFLTAYAILGAQRHAKVIGIFTRLSARDGKPGYLIHIPRVWRLLERSCRHPALAPVRLWLDRNIPAQQRRT